MTPQETMTFILTHRPGATSGSFCATQITVTWEAQRDDHKVIRTIRAWHGEPIKTLVRRIYPAMGGVGFLGADTEAEYPVGDGVGAAILQALERLFMEAP